MNIEHIRDFLKLQYGANVPLVEELIAKWEVYRLSVVEPEIISKYQRIYHRDALNGGTGFAGGFQYLLYDEKTKMAKGVCSLEQAALARSEAPIHENGWHKEQRVEQFIKSGHWVLKPDKD